MQIDEWGHDEDEEEGLSYGFSPFDDDATATFVLKPIELKPHVKNDLITMAISETCLIISIKKNRILRKKLSSDSAYEVFEIPSQKSEVNFLFLDLKGFHCIITLRNDEAFYLNLNSSRIRPLSQINSRTITSVAFDTTLTQDDTKEILMGTNKGEIILYQIKYDIQFSDPIETPVKSLFEFRDRERPTICGICFETYAVNTQTGKRGRQTLVMLVTEDSSYQFTGAKPFEKLFERYAEEPKKLKKNVKTLPRNDLKASELKLFYKIAEDHSYFMDSFAWLCGVGVCHGKFRTKEQEHDYSITVKDFILDQYQKKGYEASSIELIAESIAISEYHLFFLYPDNLTVISKITKEIVFYETFRAGENMKGMIYDPHSHSMWIYSNKSLFRLLLSGEDKDLWKLHIESGNYKEALQHCESNNSIYTPYVSGIFADNKFKSGRFIDAAILYSKSNRTFEEVILKFLMSEENEGLEFYIRKKLEMLSHLKQKKTQRMLLCTWIIELKLDKLNRLGALLQTKRERFSEEETYSYREESKYEIEEEYSQAQEEFKEFLKDYEEDLDNDTIFQLLQSHGKINECIIFATQKKNYEAVILHHINNRDIKNALEILETINEEKERNSLMLRYGSVFMKHEPKATMECLMSSFASISIDELIPALMSVDKDNRIFANDFLRKCVSNNTNKLLNNLYLFFLAEREETFSKDELIRYLEQQEALQLQNQPLNIDLEYALNVLKHFNQKEAQIMIYGILGFYTDAVKLSLKLQHLDMAKTYANKPSEEKLKKRLWLLIAENIMKSNEKTGDMKAGLQIINESKCLTIDDLLPFVSNKVKLETFKEDICGALDQYGETIQELKREMNDYNKNTEIIIDELRELQNNHIKLSTHHFCEECKQPLFQQDKFFIFPCYHGFHRNCLIASLFKYKDMIDEYNFKVKLGKLEGIQKRIDQILAKKGIDTKVAPPKEFSSSLFFEELGNLFFNPSKGISEGNLRLTQEEENVIKSYEKQFDALLYDECSMCGNMLIDTIDIPFDSHEEISWAVD